MSAGTKRGRDDYLMMDTGRRVVARPDIAEGVHAILANRLRTWEETYFVDDDGSGLSLYMAALYGARPRARNYETDKLKARAAEVRQDADLTPFANRLVALNQVLGVSVIPLQDGRMPCWVADMYSDGETGFGDSSLVIDSTRRETDGKVVHILRDWPRMLYPPGTKKDPDGILMPPPFAHVFVQQSGAYCSDTLD